jgi:hypothetical protein
MAFKACYEHSNAREKIKKKMNTHFRGKENRLDRERSVKNKKNSLGKI